MHIWCIHNFKQSSDWTSPSQYTYHSNTIPNNGLTEHHLLSTNIIQTQFQTIWSDWTSPSQYKYNLNTIPNNGLTEHHLPSTYHNSLLMRNTFFKCIYVYIVSCCLLIDFLFLSRFYIKHSRANMYGKKSPASKKNFNPNQIYDAF